MTRFWSKTIDIVDDFLAYFLTVVGILFSQYYGPMKNHTDININITTGRLVMSLVVALILIGKQEKLDNDNTEKARAGRRKNFVMRMVNALSQGIAWNSIAQLP